MSEPYSRAVASNAEEARRLARLETSRAGIHATLALAEAITAAARMLAGAMVESARIRRGQL